VGNENYIKIITSIFATVLLTFQKQRKPGAGGSF